MMKTFYDELTPYYHLIFADWEKSITRQATALDDIIKLNWGSQVTSIVDVACGIGTQVIGLAQKGYDVKGSDLSPKAIERAREEAEKRGLDIPYSICNMLEVSSHYSSLFDVLICCDNSLPHLLSDHKIKQALNEFYHCLKPGGGCLFTVRDYEKEDTTSLLIKPYKVHIVQGVKYILFQLWEFAGDIYDLSLYLTIDDGKDEAKTHIFRTKYYAVTISKIIKLMKEVGFTKVKRVESDFYQPVIIGTKEA
ncbi:class I SAM-dependent methyltransferase [Aliifodinibius sp. S!AR15-10]|uniref:class I SAM-dependent methyltransferase n=1 Tax=Aliifodinibius sp. S!AR15-10 TaxID=2950437 RepID=UPI0028675D39|nr:class I SAM-dependent methyltransferase [Aliifodinibius sp. S!AR15-10]MDR8393922.1 class I SAM-dependent methyltransferase [Aliifodinibius sp. S!AR15-10]